MGKVIDLIKHPKYIKKMMHEKELKQRIISLEEFYKHFAHLEKLNKEVHKLNKRVEKKLDKLLSKKDKPDGKK
tara:strand:+ start:844 stop:1062 length:219 start_codon:yes stop_codon:yes gene_type:complete